MSKQTPQQVKLGYSRLQESRQHYHHLKVLKLQRSLANNTRVFVEGFDSKHCLE